MNIIKTWICKLFGLSNDLNDLDLYKRRCEFYQTDYEIAQTIIESYKHDLEDKEHQIEELRKMNADPVAYVENALKESTEAYERCVADIDELLDKMDRIKHKAYARGRTDAYAEMGIRALDARLNDEILYYDLDGNVIEEMEAKEFLEFCNDNEINLEELEEGMKDTIYRPPSTNAIQGEWIHDGQNFKGGLDWCHCSICGKKTSVKGLSMYHFCPSCGAYMGERREK